MAMQSCLGLVGAVVASNDAWPRLSNKRIIRRATLARCRRARRWGSRRYSGTGSWWRRRARWRRIRTWSAGLKWDLIIGHFMTFIIALLVSPWRSSTSRRLCTRWRLEASPPAAWTRRSMTAWRGSSDTGDSYWENEPAKEEKTQCYLIKRHGIIISSQTNTDVMDARQEISEIIWKQKIHHAKISAIYTRSCDISRAAWTYLKMVRTKISK